MIAAVFAAYFLLTPKNGSMNNVVAEANRAETRRTVNMLNDLQEIKIDTNVFKDPVFSSLREEDTTLPEYTLGVKNPFKPLPTSTREELLAEEEETSEEEEIVEIVL